MLSFPMFGTAEENYSFGLGLGTSYSGIGVNISQLNENNMKYISVGCISYSTVSGSACGAGIGWIKTDIFDSDSNKHGFGGYIGVVGAERKAFFDNMSVFVCGVG